MRERLTTLIKRLVPQGGRGELGNVRFVGLFRLLGGLTIVLLAVILASCAVYQLPRDETEVYQTGLDFWQDGNYEMAIKVLSPFLEKDSLYLPLYTILADSYYRTKRTAEAFLLIEKGSAIDDTGIIENLRITFQALDNRVETHHERVNFPQYVDDVASRYAIDRSLLLAMMNTGSSFRVDGFRFSDGRGIMGLTKNMAEAAGLKVPAQEDINGLMIYGDDERLDPVKSIYNSARYLHSLIETNRVGQRNANLAAALTAFFSSVEVYEHPDSTDTREGSQVPLQRGQHTTATVDRLVQEVIENYRYYRHNREHTEEAYAAYYENNSELNNPFSSNFSFIPDIEHNLALNAYKDSHLYMSLNLAEVKHKGYYYNNLALICQMLKDDDNASEMYRNAYALLPEDDTIAFNYAIFNFQRGKYDEASTLLQNISSGYRFYEEVLILRGYSYLLRKQYHSLEQWLDRKEDLQIPHLLNINGLLSYFEGDTETAAEFFYKAFEITGETLFASNFLAAAFVNSFPEYSYASLTELNRISRQYDTGFIWPLDIRYISSGWGWRPSPFARNWRQRVENLNFHNGIDIPGVTGTPVLASAEGEVIISTNYPLGGESIFIQHPDNYITTYLHLDRRFVEEGETVKQGQIIGLLGNTGQSTGPHLHFGMFDSKNRPANPLNYLPVY